MTKCWRDEPNLRPSFEKLRNKLREMENQHKVELKSLQRDSELRSFRPKSIRPRMEVDPPYEQTVHQITKIKLLFHFLNFFQ